MNLSPNRGRGECGVPAAPAASCAKCSKAHECRHHGHTGFTRHSLRNGFTAYFVLSPATNSSCHRHQRNKVCLSPVGPTRLRQLDTSNGCQDHTASPSATTSFVCAPLITHGSFANPPCDPLRARRCRVHRIPSRVRDDRDTPLFRDRTARLIDLIWVKREWKYFCKQDSTARINRPTSSTKSHRLAHKPSAKEPASARHERATIIRHGAQDSAGCIDLVTGAADYALGQSTLRLLRTSRPRTRLPP